MRAPAGVTVAAVAGSAGAVTWALRRAVPGGAARWERTNHAGSSVTLLAGPAWTVGATLGVLAAPGVPAPVRLGATVATVGAGIFGAVDDLAGGSAEKGLRGHLGALARGRLTTGGLKVLGIGATAAAAVWPLLAAERAQRGRPDAAAGRWKALERGLVGMGLYDVGVAGALVAGTANLANLLDLRPGRVLKVVLAAACIPGGRPVGRLLRAAAAGSAVALLPADLGERAMLGDCGANAAGALLGSAVVAGTAAAPRARTTRAVALAVVVALTLASERVSFTRVIEATPVLRELDAAGRRPRPRPR